MTKIIVLTPVKNEEWILKQFLTITSLFADCIIVADQFSSDSSRDICKSFPKVHLIMNTDPEYQEDERQHLLIETARDLYPDEKRILFGLDADELFTADSLHHKATWERIRQLPPGTSLNFEKMDILNGRNKCVRGLHHHQYFPLAYVDDGILHRPDKIHSRRVPYNPDKGTVYIDDIKFLHLVYSRMRVRYAKIRFYTVLENIQRSKAFHIRRFAYHADEFRKIRNSNRVQHIQEKWLREWKELRINLKHFQEPEFSWQDYEVLAHFKKYGYKRFHTDDIWYFNWEGCVKQAAADGRETPPLPIERPGVLMLFSLRLLDQLYILSRYLRLKMLNQ